MDLFNNSSDLLNFNESVPTPVSEATVGKVSLYAGVASDDPQAVGRVIGEFNTQGFSTEAEELIATLKEQRYLEAKLFVEEVASQGNVEQLSNLITGLPSYMQESTPEKVLGVAALEKVAVDMGVNVEALMNRKIAGDTLQLGLSSRIKEAGTLSNVVELGAAMFTPFSDQMLMLGLLPDNLETNVIDYITSGTGKAEMFKRIQAMPISEQTKVIEAFNQLSADMSKATGHSVTLMPAGLINDILDPEYGGSFWMYLDDAITVLDTALVTQLISIPLRVLRGGKVVEEVSNIPVNSPAVSDTTIPTSPINTIPVVNGEKGQEIIRAAMSSDEAAQKLSGAESAAEVYRSKAMPKYSDVGKPLDTDGVPSSYTEYEAYAARLQTEIFDSAHLAGAQLSQAEQIAQMEKLTEKLKTNVNSIHLNENSLTISKRDAEDGYDVSAMYSKSSTRGWTSPELAIQEVAESLAPLGVSVEDMLLMVKQQDGTVRSVNFDEAKLLQKEMGDGFQAFVNVSMNRYWDNAGVNTFIRDKETLTTKAAKILSSMGAASDYIINPINRYDKSITSVINLMKDRGTGITGRLVEMAKPLTNLDTKSRMTVVKLLRDGDANSKKYTPQELHGMVASGKLTDKEALAVLSNYKFWDTVYLLDNRAYAKALSEKGYYMARGVDNEGVDFNLVGKPVSDVSKVDNAIDLTSNTKYVGNFEGRRVVELKDAVKGSDGEYYKFTVIPMKGSDFRAIKQTDNVLAYREGYYPRRYRGDYYVDREVLDSRGNIVEVRSMANVESLAKGNAFIETLEKSKNVRYVTRASKELQSARRTSEGVLDDLGVFSDMERGRSIQRHRGSQLKTYDDSASLELAPTLDPFESMMQSAFNTGRVSLHQEAIGSLENRWLQTYGHLMPTKSKSYPTSVDTLRGNEKEIKEAIDLFNYIEKQKEVVDTYFFKKLLKQAFTSLAEKADMLDMKGIRGMETLASVLRSSIVSDFDPVKMVRTAAFMFYIVGNPLRQAVLQTAQLAQLIPLTMKYANPKRLMQDTFALKMTTVASIDSKAYAKTIKSAAESMGVSVKEMEIIADNFRKSGLPFSVDSNSLVDGMKRGLGGEVYDSYWKSKTSAIIHGAGAPLRFAKRVGFDWGEMNNLSGTFLVAMERKRGKTPISKLTPRQWAEIGDEARRLSYNMTNVDNFAYQTGLASVPTQFAQVFHKALLNFVFGNRTLTAGERARVLAFNTTFLVGTPTVIYQSMFEEALQDAPQEVKDVVNQGIVNFALNETVEYSMLGLAGEDIDVNINIGGLSPAYGLLGTVVEAFQPFLEGDIMGTPGLSSINRAYDSLAKAHLAMTGDFGLDISTPEKAFVATTQALSMFSGVNNMNKAMIAASLEKTYFLNSKLQPVMESNMPEVIAHGLFGFTPTAVEDMYKATNKFYEGGKYTKTDAREIAEHYYSVLRRFTIGEAREEELMAMDFTMKAIHNSDYDVKNMIVEELWKLDKQSSETTSDRVFSKLLYNNSKLTKEQVEAARSYLHLHGDRVKGANEMFNHIFKEGE